MTTLLRDRFTALWQRYFNGAELPITFEYTDRDDITPEPRFVRHRCLLAQLTGVRNGRTLCLDPESASCRGLNRYANFREGMFPGFEEFLSHDAAGNGERYRRTPQQAHDYITTLPILPIRGHKLLFKRWDRLEAQDAPDGVIFFAEPDVLSGLFTLVNYDAARPDAVIAPFGSGCFSIVYQTYREQVEGSQRAVLGMFDPSARKCIKSNLLTLSIPFGKFETMVECMEESFLSTRSWEIIQRRIK